MTKYVGHVILADDSVKAQRIGTERLRVALAEKYGPGDLNTRNSADEPRRLKYDYVTGGDDTIAKAHDQAFSGETEQPPELGGLQIDDVDLPDIEAEQQLAAEEVEELGEDKDSDKE